MATEPKLCCFCLGGVTDVPSFGEIKDGEDFVSPCSTCSIQSHRKCLLDWFNALPPEKLSVIDPQTVHETFISRDNSGPIPATNGNVNPSSNTNNDQGEDTQQTPRIHINLSAGDWSFNWFGQTLAGGSSVNLDPVYNENDIPDEEGEIINEVPIEPGSFNNALVFILAPCPQCKSDIVFTMKRSSLLSLNSNTRQLIIRSIQYGGLFLGFTSAITGIVSMGYVGLTSCGLKMMDCLIPGPILVSMLTKKSVQKSTVGAYNTLSQLLLGNVNNYAIDNIEQALFKGLIDPLKFSRIPLLPIMLYRMRSSSISACLFGKSKDGNKVANWVTEFLITGYLSSLGNHELARKVGTNLANITADLLKNPGDLGVILNLFKGINFWKTNNMISMLIPIRWAYDIFARLVLNRIHFDITLRIRPREITNSLPPQDVVQLEELNDRLRELEREVRKERAHIRKTNVYSTRPQSTLFFGPIGTYIKRRLLLWHAIIKGNVPLRYTKLKLANWYYKLKACSVNDYSTTLLNKSVMIRTFTTLIWPYLSSKLGSVVLHTIIKRVFPNPDISKDKLVLLSNIIGLVGVVFLKDLANLYLSYKKASQLSKMRVLTSHGIQKNQANNQTRDTTINGFTGELDRLNSNALAAYRYLLGGEPTDRNDDEWSELGSAQSSFLSGDETDQYEDTSSFPGGYPM